MYIYPIISFFVSKHTNEDKYTWGKLAAWSAHQIHLIITFSALELALKITNLVIALTGMKVYLYANVHSLTQIIARCALEDEHVGVLQKAIKLGGLFTILSRFYIQYEQSTQIKPGCLKIKICVSVLFPNWCINGMIILVYYQVCYKWI